MYNNVPHQQYADGPNPKIYSTSQNGKGDPEKLSCRPPAHLSFFIAYDVDLFDREQIFKWDVENLDCVWISIIHCWSTLYIWCWYSMKSAMWPPVLYSCTEQCRPSVPPPPPADVFNFILFHAKFGSVIYNPGPGGLERDYMSWLETWSSGLMIVYRNVMLICSMLNKTLKTPTLLDSGRPSLCYRFYNWSGFNGSFVLRKLAQSFRRICRSQQQQVGFWYSSVYLQIILP